MDDASGTALQGTSSCRLLWPAPPEVWDQPALVHIAARSPFGAGETPEHSLAGPVIPAWWSHNRSPMSAPCTLPGFCGFLGIPARSLRDSSPSKIAPASPAIEPRSYEPLLQRESSWPSPFLKSALSAAGTLHHRKASIRIILATIQTREVPIQCLARLGHPRNRPAAQDPTTET
jgi:hypothetical protein